MASFALYMHESYNPLITLFKEFYRQDMDLSSSWYDEDASASAIGEFLTGNNIPFATEEDPDGSSSEDGAYIVRFYGEEHKNNTEYDYGISHRELIGLLNDAQDKKLYSQLQDKYNPDILPQDVTPTKEQLAVVASTVLLGLPKDIF